MLPKQIVPFLRDRKAVVTKAPLAYSTSGHSYSSDPPIELKTRRDVVVTKHRAILEGTLMWCPQSLLPDISIAAATCALIRVCRVCSLFLNVSGNARDGGGASWPPSYLFLRWVGSGERARSLWP